ncbi:MAG: hypothetical protein LBE57_01175 [Methanosarcinales archaeon]|nr:hypothetical protein [Methanosarcinales archaeon]
MIVLFSFAGNVHAADGNFGGGSGTPSDPFIIEDEADLVAIGSQSSYYYILGADIHLTSPWMPLIWFMGNLDGKGHTIFDLEIDIAMGNGIGLFSVTDGAVITNLTLESANVKGRGVVGAVVGLAQDTTFDNISVVNGNIEGGDGSDIGGLVGLMEDGSISNSSFSGSVNGSTYVGGLIGGTDSVAISNSFVTGDVIGGEAVGGLVGDMWGGSISNSFVAGNVTGEEAVGGLIGDMQGVAISNSYVTGNVTGEDVVGGLVGDMRSGFISNCMALNGFVNGTTQVHSDFGNYGGTAMNLFVWENISMNGVIGTITNISGASVVTDVGSEDVWCSYPTSPIQTINVWATFDAAGWTLNSYGKFMMPVQTWNIQTWNDDPLLKYAYVVADATHLIPEFMIIYDGNGHTAGTAPRDWTVYIWDGEFKNATIMGRGTLEKTDHTFTGWMTDGFNPERSYQPGQIRVMDSSIVLFAQWQLNESTGGGGSGTGNATVRPPPDNNTTITPPPPPENGGNETLPPQPPLIPPAEILVVLLFPIAIAAWVFVRKKHTEHEK